ncbi:GDSL-type esterase/lipase family protein [Gynuella sunshinyii]|uniref:SGNH hydrolase-type esterase domain-containing protein n=1 Tax=Gynuella sunshinyii YC6258 TaxID=1445510 RepID=A0A0C5VV62_9GAMM|nr:GDSL-type esterase/lipase family protein [Gynuella sunshinyii]AJQ94284.1 hypothetical Protein YC6258_02246 [Gynuella sunshinyii YC6258]
MQEFNLILQFYGDDLLVQENGLVARLTQHIQKSQPNCIVYNQGIKHETTSQLRQRFADEAIRRWVPEADNRIVFCYGLNDCSTDPENPGILLRETMENTQHLLHACKGKFRIFMLGVPCVYDPAYNARVKKLNQWLGELCNKTRTPYISLFDATDRDPIYKRELVQTDRICPGSRGIDKLLDLLRNDRLWWFAKD